MLVKNEKRTPRAFDSIEASRSICKKNNASLEVQHALNTSPCEQGLNCIFNLAIAASVGARLSYNPLTSDQARLPAEFKHITKRRKRN